MAKKSTKSGEDPHGIGAQDGFLSELPVYTRDSLRPNPYSARPGRGALAFAQGTSMMQCFGQEEMDGNDIYDASAGGAAVRPAVGLPKAKDTPRGAPDDTASGWL